MVPRVSDSVISQLLLAILEAHPQITVDTKAVAAVWPKDLEAPTPRAITEQLAKIRKKTGGQFTVRKLTKAENDTSGHANGTPNKSVPMTPKHVKTPRDAGSGSGSGKKRKGGSGVKKERDEHSVVTTVSAKELRELQKEAAGVVGNAVAERNGLDGCGDINYWNGDDGEEEEDDTDELESPTKRLRVSGRSGTTYLQATGEDGEERDESESD